MWKHFEAQVTTHRSTKTNSGDCLSENDVVLGIEYYLIDFVRQDDWCADYGLIDIMELFKRNEVGALYFWVIAGGFCLQVAEGELIVDLRDQEVIWHAYEDLLHRS